jgi:hypothetical protein
VLSVQRQVEQSPTGLGFTYEALRRFVIETGAFSREGFSEVEH